MHKTNMQERHKERERYFDESARTSRKYYLPYIREHFDIIPCAEGAEDSGDARMGDSAEGFGDAKRTDEVKGKSAEGTGRANESAESAESAEGAEGAERAGGVDFRVFEAGCGEGGNLAAFAELGCRVTGVDSSEPRIAEAREIFAKRGLRGEFIHSDIFEYAPDGLFDLIILHDVIEHIGPKAKLMLHLKAMLKEGGVLFAAFPPWQMPFGGHQQMASGKVVSRLPYIHLLPNFLYRAILRCGGSSAGDIEWFMDTKRTRTSIETFRRIARESGFEIIDARLYFINPHYETKFGLRPRKLAPVLSRIPYLRNFFATSSFWLLR